MIHLSRKSSMIGSPGSCRRKCLTWSTISFSSLRIAWGDNRPQRSSFNRSHRRRYPLWLQLFIVRCLCMPLAGRLQICVLKRNIEVNCALPRWWIVLLQKPLHSSITHGVLLHTSPPPPMVVFRHNKCSSILVSTSQSGLALWYFIQGSILQFWQRSSSGMGAPQTPPRPRSQAPLFHCRHFTSLPFGDAQYRWAAPLDRRSLAWICAPQFHSALLHHHHHSPCLPCTPHQAVLLSWWHTSFPREIIILPFKLHYDSLRANLSIPTL